jgi:hypothetical protein
MAGVAVAAVLALAAVLAYLRHEEIAAAVPALAEPLAAYVLWVDEMRAAIRGALSGPL